MSKIRRQISSGVIWEELVGYSRAVRVGDVVEVSGTTAIDSAGEVVAPGDLYLQTRFILEKIAAALTAAEATMEDVIRTRMYLTDISRWEEAARAHAEFFSHVKPAATAVEVSRLIRPELLIEIEVTAIRG